MCEMLHCVMCAVFTRAGFVLGVVLDSGVESSDFVNMYCWECTVSTTTIFWLPFVSWPCECAAPPSFV